MDLLDIINSPDPIYLPGYVGEAKTWEFLRIGEKLLWESDMRDTDCGQGRRTVHDHKNILDYNYFNFPELMPGSGYNIGIRDVMWNFYFYDDHALGFHQDSHEFCSVLALDGEGELIMARAEGWNTFGRNDSYDDLSDFGECDAFEYLSMNPGDVVVWGKEAENNGWHHGTEKTGKRTSLVVRFSALRGNRVR